MPLALTADAPLGLAADPRWLDADVSAAARGDADAFERLYRTHLPRVASLARWLIGGDEIEDAVQEIFIRVWQKLHTYSGQAAFGTWLHRLAVNALLRRRHQLGTSRRREADAEVALPLVAGPSSRPDLKVAIEHAVDCLPDGAREIFVLHDMEGYKHDEIAGLLGIDSGTSRSQLHRARLLLRRQLA